MLTVLQATFYCHKQVITALLEAGADPTLAGGATGVQCTAQDGSARRRHAVS